MIFLALLIFIIPLLYFWLVGHWFARVLVFLIFGVAGAVLGLLGQGPHHEGVIPLMLIGVALAWPVASIPLWVHRNRDASFHKPPNYNLTLR